MNPSQMMPSIVVTRPQPQGQHWVAQLQQHGFSAIALPLMEIGPATSVAATQSLQTALASGTQYRALMFVSANAVQHFFEHPLVQAANITAWQFATRCWAPGPGTTQALQSTGISHSQIDAPPDDATQFDSEALWNVVAPQIRPGDRILVVRGTSNDNSQQGTGRQWLTEQLTHRGASTTLVSVYERRPPVASEQLLTEITVLRQHRAIWLFSSSECIAHLEHLTQPLSPADWQTHQALTTHPRITERARQLGFGYVKECKPAMPNVCAALESLT